MDKNHLAFFEELLFGSVDPVLPHDLKRSEIINSLSSLEIHQEKNKVLLVLRDLKFQIQDKDKIEWIVNAYHERLVQLLNEVTRLINHVKKGSDFKRDLYFGPPSPLEQLSNVFTELLSFIDINFGRYLDTNSCIPICYEVQLKQMIAHRVANFRNSIDVPICKELQKILLDVLEDFINSEPGQTSYVKIHYLTKLLHYITRVEVIQDAGNQFTESIQNVLFELNFNCEAFIKYILHKLKTEVAELPEKEKLTVYSCRLKEINQLLCKTGFAFNPIHPTLQCQVATWIKEEIAFLKETGSNVTGDHANVLSKWKGYKIETSTSVPQLGNIIRLFSDVGVFQNENKTEMLEFFSDFFKTTKADNVSAGSLRKHFYNDDASVSDAVRSLLISMINKSNGKS